MSSNPPVKKALKAQPKNTVRRSKAEREALEKAENERKRLRAEAAAADAAAEAFNRRAEYGLTSGFRGGRGDRRGGRNARGGRGTFMGGQRIVTRAPMAQSYFSGGMLGTSRGRAGGLGAHGGSSIKREPGIKREGDGDIAMLGIKRDPDDYGYISSDDEQGLGPRTNVDEINLISEDEEEEDRGEGSNNRDRSGKTPVRRRRIGGFMPIRLSRKEHKDRVLGMNTDASTTTSEALRKKAEEKSNAEPSTTFDEALTSVTRKATTNAKSKLKDVEIVGDAKKWKGVYDDDDDEPSDVQIKEEPVDETSAILDTLATAATELGETEQSNTTEDKPSEQEPEPESKAGVKARIKQRKRYDTKPTQYQTAEEIREWDKHKEDLVTIQQELGSINLHVDPKPETDAAEPSDQPPPETEQADKKEDAIYLFQFPPIMPDLLEPSVKKEPESPGAERSRKGQATTAADQPIKLEDDEFGGDPSASRAKKLSVATGWAGKLRVHKSGRVTMTWGGTDMEMKMGISPYFLQTAILTRMTPPDSKPNAGASGSANTSASEFGGEAVAFGQIRGKLVVTPNWTDILG